MEGALASGSQVAIYARVSTEEQREGQTIDSQVAELERFARDRTWVVVGVYKDEGWSGALLARPALDRLRDDASGGHFKAVLINDVDRLARDVTHLGVLRRHLERAGARVVFRKLPAEASPTQNLLVNVLGSFAEFERELIADRTRRGRRHKIEVRKQFLGCIPPYGYRYVSRSSTEASAGQLLLEPAEAAIVRQMFAWVDAEGLSGRAVVDRLNARGVPPRKGRKWQTSSALRILHSLTYVGTWHYNKSQRSFPQDPQGRTDYDWEPKGGRRYRPTADWLPLSLPPELRLVDADRWQRVQRQLQQNRVLSPRNTKHEYLLRGLIRCGNCSSRFHGEPQHGHFFYRCGARCGYPSVREEIIDAEVWTTIERALQDPAIVAEQVAKFNEARRARSAETGTQRDAVQAAIGQAKGEEARLLEAYRLEILSAEQLRTELNGVQTRLASLQEELSRLQSASGQLSSCTIDESTQDLCRHVATRLASLSFADRQRLLRTLITEIVFDGDRIVIRALLPDRGNSEIKPTCPPSSDGPCADGQSGTRRAVPRPLDCRAFKIASAKLNDSGGLDVPEPAVAIPIEVERPIRRLPRSRPLPAIVRLRRGAA